MAISPSWFYFFLYLHLKLNDGTTNSLRCHINRPPEPQPNASSTLQINNWSLHLLMQRPRLALKLFFSNYPITFEPLKEARWGWTFVKMAVIPKQLNWQLTSIMCEAVKSSHISMTVLLKHNAQKRAGRETFWKSCWYVGHLQQGDHPSCSFLFKITYPSMKSTVI